MTYPNIADPNTWAVGTVDANDFKTNLTDVLNAGELYQSYTPTLTAVTTNPTLSKWTRTGLYVQVGKRVDFEATFTYTGAGSGDGVGAGGYFFGLPVAPAQSTILVVGHGVVTGSNNYPFIALMTTASGSTTCQLLQLDSTNFAMGAGGPYSHAWVTNNVARISGTYRAA